MVLLHFLNGKRLETVPRPNLRPVASHARTLQPIQTRHVGCLGPPLPSSCFSSPLILFSPLSSRPSPPPAELQLFIAAPSSTRPGSISPEKSCRWRWPPKPPPPLDELFLPSRGRLPHPRCSPVKDSDDGGTGPAMSCDGGAWRLRGPRRRRRFSATPADR